MANQRNGLMGVVRLCPSTVPLRALISFRSRKRHFLQVQGSQRHCAEAYLRTPHKRFQTCHARGVIDADLSRSRRGIAEKGHLWTETRSHRKPGTNRHFPPGEVFGAAVHQRGAFRGTAGKSCPPEQAVEHGFDRPENLRQLPHCTTTSATRIKTTSAGGRTR